MTMKPAPDGYLAVLGRYPDIPPDRWLSIGDSWIDGKAAIEAGVSFVAYRSDAEAMRRNGVNPAAWLTDVRRLLDLI